MADTLQPVPLVVPHGQLSALTRKGIETAVGALLKEDEKGALVVMVDHNGEEVVGSLTAVYKTKKGWQFVGNATWDGDLSASVAVVKTWK